MVTSERQKQRIDELFDQAVRLPIADQRAFLDAACTSDPPEIRAEIERLLRANSRAAKERFLDEGPLDERVQLGHQPSGEPIEVQEAKTPTTKYGSYHETSDARSGNQDISQTVLETDVVRETPKQVGRYRVKELLGEGGFGRVYLAHDERLKRDVAVKVPHARMISRPHDADAYLSEAQTIAFLEHAHIVPVYDVGQTDRFPCFMVSKYIDGTTLGQLIKTNRPSFLRSAELMTTVAEALHYAHTRGVVHRDIKPGNILIDREGNPHVVDFGLALKESDVGKGPRFAGTLAYMSPELSRGEGHRVDGRSDIYSLGTVLYEMLVGRRTFDGESKKDLLEQIATQDPKPPRQIDDSIPKELERICLKTLAKRASDRYTTALDMAHDLRRFLAEHLPARAEASAVNAQSDTSQARPDSDTAKGNSVRQPIRIVPKGLRSFDERDADFFLELLPGPRDREGLPDSVRFWKTRIEETDPGDAFTVGIIYGPSGCGKSSLIKAGVLPRLSEDVIAVYVESSGEDTEHRLRIGLRKRCPGLSKGLDLTQMVSALRRGHGTPLEKKVLIVLDQFEQWLHAHKNNVKHTQLMQALRHCDGKNVQCVLLVRDDFWMATTRFMRELEVCMLEGQNSAAVDLFDLDHAQRVLIALGRAFGRLPEDDHELSQEQEDFIRQAVAGLTEDGKVICVRLALVAEMIKGKPWTIATLRKVGGAGGVGTAFLEETFSANTAPPVHRYHQTAIRAVLSDLLPDSGTDIKGNVKSRAELLESSGYRSRPRDFGELLRILDGELRIITPIDSVGCETDPGTDPDARYYQITHDYLVFPLREWLNRQRRDTRRGRAELLLEERTHEWSHSRQDRLLPSALECVNIALFTSHRRWTEVQCENLRRALFVHGRTLGAGAAIIAVMVFALTVLLQPPDQFELLTAFEKSNNPEAQISAFDRLDLTNSYVYRSVSPVIEKIDDPRVVNHSLQKLEKFVELAENEKASDSIRSDIINLTEQLFIRDSSDVGTEAFIMFARLAPPADVLNSMTNYVGDSKDERLVDGAVDYINRISLTELPEAIHGNIIRQLISMIDDARHPRLVSSAMDKLDKIEPDRLLTWILTAYQDSGASVVLDGLESYANQSTPNRVYEIGSHAEERLAAIINGLTESSDENIEVAFLMEVLGQLVKAKHARRYDKGLEMVSFMLDRQEEFGHSVDLEIVIETFASLNSDKRMPIDSLRAFLNDDELLSDDRNWFIVTAAAKALGDLHDIESLSVLENLALASSKAPLNVRIAAVYGLGRLGEDLRQTRSNAKERMEIAGILTTILRGDNEFDLVSEALDAVGRSGDQQQANAIFPLLLDNELGMAPFNAVHAILANSLPNVDQLVRSYLEWKVTSRTKTRGIVGPDEAIVDFTGYDEVIQSEAAKAVVLALANAQIVLKDPAARELGDAFLKRALSGLDGAPRIDPIAEKTNRTKQLDDWLKWWNETRDNLRVQGDGLVQIYGDR